MPLPEEHRVYTACLGCYTEAMNRQANLARALRDVLSYRMDWPPPLTILDNAEKALQTTPLEEVPHER
jgi:hypothetical protein